MNISMSKKRVGEQLVDILNKLGIEFFFGTPGTEFAPIIERFDELDSSSGILPVTVPHEYLAVNMAYGTYLANSKPAAVMVHNTIGTLNAAAAIMNAHRMCIPLIFIAGRTATTENDRFGCRDLFIHWAQESFDQASSIREYVKWDYELRDASMLSDVLNRAYAIAMEEPRGPVYLVLPREIMLEEVDSLPVNISNVVPTRLASEKKKLIEIANLINNSKRPVILSKTIGETLDGYSAFANFCKTGNIPAIMPDANYMNMSTEHPMHMGHNLNDCLAESDLIINLDMDVPWIPKNSSINKDAIVVHIGVDPLFKSIPIRSFPAHHLIRSNPALALEQIIEYLIESRSTERLLWIQKLKNLKSKKLDEKDNDSHKFSKEKIASIIGKYLTEEMILLNELSLPIEEIPFKYSGTYFRTGSASGLGWAMGAGLGLGLVKKDKIIINVIGDGAYYFGNPLAYHWCANALELKMITIILNNGGMHSIAKNVKDLLQKPERANNTKLPFLNLTPSLKFEEIAKTFNGVGNLVSTCEDFETEFEQAIKLARHGSKQTIMNCII
ncbi:MAG: thiamine pyrophosphate-requiring protein [Rhizobacter sp.]|nr:thiamine pyrophosphate-requiring protein [Bacteriovorax sp.]